MPDDDLSIIIPPVMKGKRLDQALAELCPQHSRSRLQQWIKSGNITVDNLIPKQRDVVRGGENVAIRAHCPPGEDRWSGQDIPLDLLYADGDIIVLNKPPGLVVHPGAGNPKNTLLNALLFRFPELEQIPRAGIVQRLDKDTSGIMVVARSLTAHTGLVKQLQQRELTREYEAIVAGVMTAGGRVDAPVGRHRVQRKRMAVTETGKPAVTHYRVIERFDAHTHVRLRLESGRTHQIRVHMAHIRHPITGDPVYGGRRRFPRNAGPALLEALQSFPRQALHASRIALRHPATGESVGWEAPLPGDMQALLRLLHTRGD